MHKIYARIPTVGKIYILRHGQSEDNANRVFAGHNDTSLTQLGRQQSLEAGEKLKNYKIDLIYSSPLKRAFETAEIISQELGKEFSIDDDLIERNFGVQTGKPESEVNKYSNKILEYEGQVYFLDGEGVEEFPDLYYRAKQLIQKIKQKHPNQNVLLITHGDLGKMIIAANKGWNWDEGLKTPYFANAEIVELS